LAESVHATQAVVTALGPQPPPYATPPAPALGNIAAFGAPLPVDGRTRNLMQVTLIVHPKQTSVPSWYSLLHTRHEAPPRLSETVCFAHQANPVDACTELLEPSRYAGAAVLVERGGCSFVHKVAAVQRAGGAVAIVMNHAEAESPDEMITMGLDGTGDQVDISAVFVPRATGLELLRHLQQPQSVLNEVHALQRARSKAEYDAAARALVCARGGCDVCVHGRTPLVHLMPVQGVAAVAAGGFDSSVLRMQLLLPGGSKLDMSQVGGVLSKLHDPESLQRLLNKGSLELGPMKALQVDDTASGTKQEVFSPPGQSTSGDGVDMCVQAP
jgi:hypothetical protein